MTIWAIADLHLANAVPEKMMDVFGEPWIGYMDKIKTNWIASIGKDDLVLIPGDISWAMNLEDAKVDLEWIHALPGEKVLLRGNHDYWWSSLKQIKAILPPSLHLIQNNTFIWNEFVIGGARLWDTPEFNFKPYINFVENPRAKNLAETDVSPDAEKIFARELGRLELSLQEMQKHPGTRIAMTHYPPIGSDLAPTKASQILEKYGITHCVFGHLHNLKKGISLFGEKNGIHYQLTAADYLDFKPLRLL